jgi:hypothetical protein
MKKLFLLLSLSLFTIQCNDAKDTVYNEFKVSTLLKKYEYFKDLSAAIDKKRADIELYQIEVSSYTKEDDRFYVEQRKSELIGIIAMHNQLCAEYNSAMSKFNYRFTNIGDLPEGATEPLPREYKPYINKLTK